MRLDFKGSGEEALRFIVDRQLSPSVLGRSAFCEAHLDNEIRLGCRQYVVFKMNHKMNQKDVSIHAFVERKITNEWKHLFHVPVGVDGII